MAIHHDTRFRDAFNDLEGVWAWVGEQRANTKTVTRLPDGSARLDFRWTPKRMLGRRPIELIFEHELLDESEEPVHWGDSIGPRWEKRALYNEFSCTYVIHPSGSGEGW